MKRHQINIFTSRPGKTWASCSTCRRASKQGTKANAEAWMAKHQEEVLNTPRPKKQKRRSEG
jgi:hypothetical protein